MKTQEHPLEVYRRFQSCLLAGEFGRLGEVADMEGYTENCVGLTGWTTGLAMALRNFQENIASRLTGMVPTENDIVQMSPVMNQLAAAWISRTTTAPAGEAGIRPLR